MNSRTDWLAILPPRSAELGSSAWLRSGSWCLLERYGRDERGRYVEMRMVRA